MMLRTLVTATAAVRTAGRLRGDDKNPRTPRTARDQTPSTPIAGGGAVTIDRQGLPRELRVLPPGDQGAHLRTPGRHGRPGCRDDTPPGSLGRDVAGPPSPGSTPTAADNHHGRRRDRSDLGPSRRQGRRGRLRPAGQGRRYRKPGPRAVPLDRLVAARSRRDVHAGAHAGRDRRRRDRQAEPQEARYDPETGQVAVGVAPGEHDRADRQHRPCTRTRRRRRPRRAGHRAGRGAQRRGRGREGPQSKENATTARSLLVDGASGKVTKQIPLKQAYLTPPAGGAKHAYLYGMKYTS